MTILVGRVLIVTKTSMNARTQRGTAVPTPTASTRMGLPVVNVTGGTSVCPAGKTNVSVSIETR